MTEKIVGENSLNRSVSITDFFVINDADFGRLKSTVDNRYQLKYYLFNTPNIAYAKDFHYALLQIVVDVGNGKMLDNFFGSPIRELMLAEGKDIPSDDIKEFPVRKKYFYP